MSRQWSLTLSLLLLGAACGSSSTPATEPTPKAEVSSGPIEFPEDEREVHLSNLRQLTRDAGENAEAYWAFGGKELIMQSKRPPFGCDQIFRLPIDGGEPQLVSTGTGRTTCAYFLPGDEEIVFSSTHESGEECPPVPDHSQGYVWPIYSEYNIFVANADGSNLRKLTDTPHYDAEATVCPVDGSILFTSTRNGDLDLYRMDRDGKNVVQLTNTPGYDGGAFFSQDCKQIVWRASRPKGDALADYQRLLNNGLVRPSKLEIFVANADGSDARQLTYLNRASFAPFFHPSGKRVLFSSSFADPSGREFDIWAINTDGTNLERITHAPGFDGFPMFSPDGKTLAFSSNRNQANPGETDVFIADWSDEGMGETHPVAADRFVKDVMWLADDAREGRGVGTKGLSEAADFLANQFKGMGLVPGNGDSYFQELSVAVEMKMGSKSSLAIGPKKAGEKDFIAMGFAADGKINAQTVHAGHGIVAKELGIDDFAGKKLEGKIAVIERYVPANDAFKDRKLYDKHSSLHRKAFLARERGAKAVIIVNGAPDKDGEEAELPKLQFDRLGGIGIPVVMTSRAFGAGLLSKKPARVKLDLQLDRTMKPSSNVLGLLETTASNKLPGVVVVGAHYDHLGMGDENSLSGGEKAVHNGADDNASGTAGLLQVARSLSELAKKGELQRDVLFIAFTAEEKGLVGAKHFVDNRDKTVEIHSMFNMDMIGRMRSNTLSVLGAGTATEWPPLIEAACQEARINCRIGPDGYGPSDHSAFYGAGVPVIYISTGVHTDYHKPSDDAGKINGAGGAAAAGLLTSLVVAATGSSGKLSYQKTGAPSGGGDRRSFGASLGTIPDYTGDTNKPGMLLSGVRPGGAADRAGMKGGDRILSIGDTKLHSVKDLVYILQDAKPGETAKAVILRGGRTIEVEVTFQKSSRRKH